MVLINRCCCWKSVRRGSFASGIFTLMVYVVLLTISVFHVNDVVDTPDVLIFSILMLIFSFLSVVSSLMLLVGLCVDNRLLLLPWIVSISLSTLLNFTLSFYLIPDVVENPVVGALFVTDIVFCVFNVYCIVCVISQYQQYLAGRGRAGQNPNSQPIPTVRFQPSYGTTQNRNVPSVSFQVAQNGVFNSSGFLMVPSPNSSSLCKSPHPTDLISISEDHSSSNDISRKMSTDDSSANDEAPQPSSSWASNTLLTPPKLPPLQRPPRIPSSEMVGVGSQRDHSCSSAQLLAPAENVGVSDIKIVVVGETECLKTTSSSKDCSDEQGTLNPR